MHKKLMLLKKKKTMNTTAEIKNYLHQLIVETNDINVLTQITDAFKQLKSKNADWWDELSKEQKNSIKIGLNQLKNGEGIAHEDVRARIDKRLSQNG